MFCLYCGNSLPDGALFCNRCGKRQDTSGNHLPPIQAFSIIPGDPHQYPAENVPMVQGTPQSGFIPNLQGTPAMRGTYPAGRGTYSNSAPPGSQPSPPLQAPYPAPPASSSHVGPSTPAAQSLSPTFQQTTPQPLSQQHLHPQNN